MKSSNGNQQGDIFLATSVEFDKVNMYIHLTDGRVVTVPVTTFKRLWDATPEQRLSFRIFGRGLGIRWDEIDEDLSVPGLVRDFGIEQQRTFEQSQKVIS